MSEFFQASDGKIHYKIGDVSDKPIVFFVHGASPSSQHTEFWNSILPIMEKYCTPVRIDSYGHGKTKYEGTADFFVKATGIKELVLYIISLYPNKKYGMVGRSLGGAITQYLVSEELTSSLDFIGLIAPAARERAREWLSNWSKPVVVMWDISDPAVSFSSFTYIRESAPHTKLFTAGDHPDAVGTVLQNKDPTHAPELVYPELFEMFLRELCT